MNIKLFNRFLFVVSFFFCLLGRNNLRSEGSINVVLDEQLPKNAVPMDDPNAPLNPYFLKGKKQLRIIPDDAVPSHAVSLNGSDLPQGLSDPQKEYKMPMLQPPSRILDLSGAVGTVTNSSEFVVESSLPKPKSNSLSPLQIIESEQLLRKDILSSNTIEPFNPMPEAAPVQEEIPVCKVPPVKIEVKKEAPKKKKKKKKKKGKKKKKKRKKKKRK